MVISSVKWGKSKGFICIGYSSIAFVQSLPMSGGEGDILLKPFRDLLGEQALKSPRINFG